MLTIKTYVTPSPEQWEIVIEGMRNPMNSWSKSDSFVCTSTTCPEQCAKCSCNTENIFGRFHATLDLEGMNSVFDQVGYVIGEGKVLEGKGICLLAVSAFVGETAGLRTLASVAASSTDKGREKALSRMANAKRAVSERLYFNGGVLD